MPRQSLMQSKTLTVIYCFIIIAVTIMIWLTMRHIVFSTFAIGVSGSPNLSGGTIFDASCLMVIIGAAWVAFVK